MKKIALGLLILTGLAAVAWASVPTTTMNMAAIVPTLNTDDCVHKTISASTSTVVSTALSTRKAYDYVSDGGDCWCVFHSSASGTATTGRFYPNGVIVIGRPANARMACYCDADAEFAVCPDDAE